MDQDGLGGRVTANSGGNTDLELLTEDKYMQIQILEVTNSSELITTVETSFLIGKGQRRKDFEISLSIYMKKAVWLVKERATDS